ncbi:hypothetical protein YC2023_115691 [Brassica napus]
MSCHEHWNTSEETYFGISYLLISCLEMLETSALGLGQDLGLLLVLGGVMTNSAYVSRYSFNLIPYRFKVRDRFSAYTTCMSKLVFLFCDRGVRTEGSRKFVPGKRYPPILSFVRQIADHLLAVRLLERWSLNCFCMKAVLSFIAKDVVGK